MTAAGAAASSAPAPATADAAGSPAADTAGAVAPSPAPRLEALTGIRIIAAGAVFLSHVPAPPFGPDVLRTTMTAGYNGVTLFFILSGFVLAWNYTDRLARPSRRAIASFAVARLARIYPLYLAALLWAAGPALVTGTLPKETWLHVLAAQAWSPDVAVTYQTNTPGWSIGVEFFLYATFPLLVLVLAPLRRSRALLLTAGAVAVAVVFGLAWWFQATGRASLPWTDGGSAHRWLDRTPLTRIPDFVVGMVAALLIKHHRAPSSDRLGRAAQLGGVVAIALLMTSSSVLHSVWSWDSAYVVPVFALLWGLAAAPRSVLARVLASRPFVLAGEASFAFYLLHLPLLGRIGILTATDWYWWLFATVLVFAMILVASVGAHVVVERPAQRWIRGTYERLASREATSTDDDRRQARPRPAEP